MNDTHYTAEEVRKYADMLGPETRGIKMLRAFAARLEADEKRPAPASSERLAEALRSVRHKIKSFGWTTRDIPKEAAQAWVEEIETALAAHTTAQPPAEPVKAVAEIPSQEWMMRVARSWREADESDGLSGEDQMLDRVCYVIRSAMRDAQQPAASVPPSTVCMGIDTALLMIETCDFSALKEACAAQQESKAATAGDNG